MWMSLYDLFQSGTLAAMNRMIMLCGRLQFLRMSGRGFPYRIPSVEISEYFSRNSRNAG